MKKIIYTTLVAALTLSGTIADAAKADHSIVKGNIIDTRGEAIGFATVVARSADGSVAAGVSSDEAGTFSFDVLQGEYTLTVSLIGYKETTLTFKTAGANTALPAIVLLEDTEILNAATVQAVIPKVKLTGEGLQTSVKGTVLEDAGTAEDVLSKTPGMMKSQNGLEVIGRGTPVIYINGRKMTDSGELKRIMSNEIQNVEVISNPGAQYDAQVRSVVRIRTVRKQGEGFGFNLDLSDEQSLRKKEFNDPNLNFNANYRVGSVDIFGGVNAFRFSSRQESVLTGENLLKPRFTQKADLTNDYIQKTSALNGGVNWQISDNHSVGFKVTGSDNFATDQHQFMDEKVWREGVLFDDLQTESTVGNGDVRPRTTTANVYYNGTAGKLGIDLNLDWFGSRSSSLSHSMEKSIIEDRIINYSTDNSSDMYAGKLVLSYPIWKGQFQAGTEDVFSTHKEKYSLTGAPIPASDSDVNEKNLAAFANYAFVLPKVGQFSAGVRYEHVDYAYHCIGGTGKESIERKYDNFFPTLSYAGVIGGKVQAMLNYSVKTTRPNFSLLSDAVRYNNKYTLQSGNASLQPQYTSTFTATAVWNFLTFALNYDKTRDGIMTWSERYMDAQGSPSDGVLFVSPKNLNDPVRTFQAIVVATPTIGIWTLHLTAAVQQQWLTIHYKDTIDPSLNRDLDFSGKPMFICNAFNYFRFKHGWQLELGGEFHSKSYVQNMLLTRNYFDLTAAVQKTLLKDGSLVLRLSGSDLAGQALNNVKSDFGAHLIEQTNRMDTQRVKLALRYNFNTANNKYKGSGAGQDVKSRLK